MRGKNKTVWNKIKRKHCKLAKITSQVEQLEVKRKVAQLSVSGGYYVTSVTLSATSGTSVSTVTMSTDWYGLAFGGNNAKMHKR